MKTTDELSKKEKLLDFFKRRNVSFVEIEKNFPEYFESKDELNQTAMSHLEFKNIIFWCGIKTELIDILNELLAEKKIIMKPAPVLVYLIDGSALSFPVAKSERNYKTLHWCPVTFSLPNGGN